MPRHPAGMIWIFATDPTPKAPERAGWIRAATSEEAFAMLGREVTLYPLLPDAVWPGLSQQAIVWADQIGSTSASPSSRIPNGATG